MRLEPRGAYSGLATHQAGARRESDADAAQRAFAKENNIDLEVEDVDG